MLLPFVTLACVSILVSRHKILGDNDIAHIVSLFSGSAISGLLMLGGFEETARTMTLLKNSSFDAIRQQSFHDAGLLTFFYSAIVLDVVLGFLIVTRTTGWKERIRGAAVICLGIGAFPLMTTAWPRLIGILSAGPGLKQRASLLSLWLAIMVVLTVASSRYASRSRR